MPDRAALANAADLLHEAIRLADRAGGILVDLDDLPTYARKYRQEVIDRATKSLHFVREDVEEAIRSLDSGHSEAAVVCDSAPLGNVPIGPLRDGS